MGFAAEYDTKIIPYAAERGMAMKRKKIPDSESIVRRDVRIGREGGEFSLYEIMVDRFRFFAMSIVHRGECAMEVLGSDPVKTRELFERILEGEASPMHLFDVVSDERACEAFC